MTTLELQLREMPFFEKSEAGLFGSFTANRSLDHFGVLSLEVENADHAGKHIAEIASLYLITNVILMSRASKKIVKTITLDTDGSAIEDLFPALNALRYYARGDFSQLDNFQAWYTLSGLNAEAHDASLDDLKRVINFVVSAELSARDIGQKNAETILGVRCGERTESQGLIGHQVHPFLLELTAREFTSQFFLREVFFHPSFRIAYSMERDLISIWLDAADVQSALASWSMSIRKMLDSSRKAD
jgi:hypothetical protein